MKIEELAPLSPASFFDVGVEIGSAKDLSAKLSLKHGHRFPDLSELIGEESFSRVGASWSEKGLQFFVHVDLPFIRSEYPQYEKTDCFELCIDTRHIVSSRVVHQFCHHFVVLAAANLETSALEITRFRGEDKHDLCRPEEIVVEREFLARSYQLKVTLPASILHGFDPEESPTLGIAYAVHRTGGKPQNFHLSNQEFQVMQTPALYASMHLKGGK